MAPAGSRRWPRLNVGSGAAEVCLNNALKGDLRSFAKAMEIAEKFGVLKPGSIQQEVTHITRTIVDPRDPDTARDK
jgi:hypothetical protein